MPGEIGLQTSLPGTGSSLLPIEAWAMGNMIAARMVFGGMSELGLSLYASFHYLYEMCDGFVPGKATSGDLNLIYTHLLQALQTYKDVMPGGGGGIAMELTEYFRTHPIAVQHDTSPSTL